MARLPAYRKHKASGQAIVMLTDATTRRCADVCLCDYGTPVRKAAYDTAIRLWLEGGRVVERSGRKGENGVADDGIVLPAPLAHVEAVKRHVAPQVRAVIDLQLLTGARGGELLIMRPVDIDTTGKVWLYRPATHTGPPAESRGQTGSGFRRSASS
jgi:integrase